MTRLTGLDFGDLYITVSIVAQGTNDFADSHADAGYSCDPAYAPLVAHRCAAHRVVSTASLMQRTVRCTCLGGSKLPGTATCVESCGALLSACRHRRTPFWARLTKVSASYVSFTATLLLVPGVATRLHLLRATTVTEAQRCDRS